MKVQVEDIPALTGMRGIAALMVVVYHANLSAFRDTPNYADRVIFHGQLYVDLFFILSGFVLSHVYLTRQSSLDWRGFYAARFARIFPLHALTAVVAAAGLVALGVVQNTGWPQELTVAQAIREFTLTQALPLVGSDGIWNSPSWSVSVEFWTYFLAFPVVLLLTNRVNWMASVAAAAIAIVALAVFLSISPETSSRGWSALLRAVVGFFAGWAVWKTTLVVRSGTMPSWSVDLVAITLLLVTQFGERNGWVPWYAIFLMPILVFGVVNTDSVTKRIMENRTVLFLGLVSYSIYLWHPIVLKLVQLAAKRIPGLEQSIPFYVAATLAITIPLAAASYYLFESPCRKALRKWIGPSKVRILATS